MPETLNLRKPKGVGSGDCSLNAIDGQTHELSSVSGGAAPIVCRHHLVDGERVSKSVS